MANSEKLIFKQHYAGHRMQGGRDYQEDNFGFDQDDISDLLLMILADGMGGHEGGARASHLVTRGVIGNFRDHKGSVAERLDYALHQANALLSKEVDTNPHLEGMGSTLLAVAIYSEPGSDYQMEWISVGDSPLWLYRAGHITRQNADHSMKPVLEEQVRSGKLKREDALSHPDRNMLRSALIGDAIELIDRSLEPLELYPGDRVVLASDGMLTLADAEIAEVLGLDVNAETHALNLLKAIEKKHKKDQDNATAAIFLPPTPASSPANKPRRRFWPLF